MFNTRKLAVAFLALVLALPVTDVSLAFAAPESEGGNAVQDSDGVGGDLDSTESSDSLLDEEDPTALAPPGASPLDVDSAKASSEEGTEGLNEDASEGVVVDPTDVIEYVYLDEQVVTLGQEQYIAFGLLDEDAVIAQAEITFLKSSTEEEVSYSTNTVAQNAALFTLEFSDEQDATGYQLLEIAYRVAGSSDTYRADFSALSGQQEGDSYCFDVVTPQVADVLSAEPTEDGEVTAFAITDGGGFVAADSVEDALAIADADGVDKVDAGESIVDPEALSSQDPSDSDATTSPSWLDSLASVLTPLEAYAAASPAREDYLIVALDPGHGASDPGTSGNNLVEKDLNWKIAQACYTELLTYTGVSAMLTRAENENPGLQDRVNRAVACGADVFVSLHNNAGGGTGSEVWVPNNATYNNGTHVVGEQLASKILAQLTKLGLANRGVKTRDNTTNEKYPDGSLADYYTVINASRRAGIPAIIVEHAFLDNASDATKLKDDTFLASLGTADATGIAQQYSLVTAASAQSAALVKYRSHISSLGWETYVYDQKVSGTTGKSRGIEAFDIQLQNQTTTGAIQYNAYVTGIGWQGWKDSGEAAGTTGQSKTVQAMQVRLTGNMANRYDVYYRVHVSNIGWLGWARNGASAGSVGYGYNAEAFEVALVAKGAAAPGSTATPFKESNTATSVAYQAHVAEIGWQAQVTDGATAGTTGRSLRIEALKVSLASQEYPGGIQYNAHCAYIGWQGWRSNGQTAGTTGQSRQMEAVQIMLTGEMADRYDVYYRAHCENFGWLGWAKDGASAGSVGYGYRMEALQVRLVPKGGAAPGSTDTPFRQPLVAYQAHVAEIGWQAQVTDGATAGTTGRSLRIEALKVSLASQEYPGGIQYNAHCAYIGWQGWRSNGQTAGTTGQSRQMEAVQIMLTGEMADRYDVYYRAHCENFGWLGWAKDGASAGSVGYGYRMEALQVRLVPKGGAAPGSTSNAFREKAVTASNPIIGGTNTNVAQMARYYTSSGHVYPAAVYASKGAPTIQDFCQIVYTEATAEGVRPEVVFCQAMYESGWLGFGGDVQASQCNFCGLKTRDGSAFATFPDVRTGERAHVQHLKAYAVSGLKASDLAYPCVDPRFDLVAKGSAPTLEGLNGKWAVPGTGYGERIASMINALYKA